MEKFMKNSKIKLLTATACLALVGTASAAWVYSGTATESANIGVKVASYASAGSITVTGNDKIYVLLDNGSVKFARDSDTDTLSATHVVPTEFKDETRTVAKTFSVMLSPAVYEYVTFADGVTCDTLSLSTSDGSTKDGCITTGTYNWTDGVDIFGSLPELKWNKTVSSETEYKTLINAISDSAITDWSTQQNQSWNASELNEDWWVMVNFYAEVPNA